MSFPAGKEVLVGVAFPTKLEGVGSGPDVADSSEGLDLSPVASCSHPGSVYLRPETMPVAIAIESTPAEA